MQKLGFIHDMLDTKVLILFVLARAKYPASLQQIYELCLQDDYVSYFDICIALPEMVQSGHLSEKEKGIYEITDKGRADGALTEHSLIYSLRTRAENAVDRFNRQIHRSSFVKSNITADDAGECAVNMELNDGTGKLMTLELMAPNQRQANRLSRKFEEKAEVIYNMIIAELLEDDEENES